MKHPVLIGLAVAVGILMAACGTVPESQGPPVVEQATGAVEPLRLDDEPLLLLDDAPAPLAEGGADNSRCHVCHMNYTQDSLALTHAAADMGCNSCHGECDEHIADESWAWGGNGTAPDIMYTLDQINPFCTGCHDKDTLEGEMHEAVLAGTSKQKYCTDCHGDHRLTSRKCKWK